MSKRTKKVYILYDGRACGAVGTESAAVFVTCASRYEAESWRGLFGTMACYSYDLIQNEKGENEAVNQKWEWDYHAEEEPS